MNRWFRSLSCAYVAFLLIVAPSVATAFDLSGPSWKTLPGTSADGNLIYDAGQPCVIGYEYFSGTFVAGVGANDSVWGAEVAHLSPGDVYYDNAGDLQTGNAANLGSSATGLSASEIQTGCGITG